MIAFLNELLGHLRRNRAPYILGALGLLLTSLFLAVWRSWLFPFLARHGEGVPREALGALIGGLIIFLSASVTLTVIYFRKWKTSETENKTLAHLPKQLEKVREDNRALRMELEDIEAQRSSASVELQQALAHLHSFSENLPRNGDIEEKFVNEYHGILTSIETETSQNLDSFRVKESEVRHHETRHAASTRIGRQFSPAHTTYSQHRYCDREVFLTRLHGLLKHLAQSG